MVLHLFLPDPDPIQDEIRLLPNAPMPRTPRLQDWVCDPRPQILTHVSTGCQYHAYRLPSPLVQGLTMPFEKSYDIAVKFTAMKDDMPLPAPDDVLAVGREALVWILTYTYESFRRRA